MSSPVESRLRGMYTARVASNRQICLDHYRLVLHLEGFAPSRPGQFVNLRCGSAQPVAGAREVVCSPARPARLTQPEVAGPQPLLRRPFSIAGRRDRPDGAVELEVIHHVVGVGTAWLAELAVGAEVSLLGPLGNGFTILEDRPAAAVVGGGVGIPPLIYLAEALTAGGKQVVAFAGARTGRSLPLTVDPAEPPSRAGWPTFCVAEFSARSVPTVVATDDGSLGFAGMVHEAFARWLDRDGPAAEALAVYACGPEPMMKAVADICLARALPCQLALERHMACGMGTCQGCVCKVKADAPPGWAYKLVCKDGPVFPAEELLWE